MNKLSRREWILIYIMAVMIILVGGILLLINPAIEKNDELELTLISRQEEEQNMRQTIAQKTMYASELADFQKKTKKLKKTLFLAYMENEDLDETVTGMVLQSGMKPQDLSVTSMSMEQIQPYGTATSTGTEAPATETAGGQAEADVAADLNAAASAGTGTEIVKADKISFKTTGTIANFVSLMRIIRETKGVRLTAFKVAKEEVAETGSGSLMDSLNQIVKPSATNRFGAEIEVEIYQNNNLL